MNLPYSGNLPVSKLAASFGNTSATYQFYWLLSYFVTGGVFRVEPT